MATKRPSAQEVADIKEMFKRHDTDNDGTINPAEFKLMLARLGILLNPADEQKLFNQIDLDGSGKIEVGEFIDHYKTILELERAAETKKLAELQAKTTFTMDELKAMYANFKRIATTNNDDGLIDKMEFRTMMVDSQLDGQQNMVFYDALFRMFDRDGSGGIDFTEFVLALALYYGKMPQQNTEERSRFFFSIYDVDGDGAISKADISKVLADSLTANHVILDDAHIQVLVEDTFKRYPSASSGKIDFATFKAIMSKKTTK
jgi:Ca2+-binding EF-hand superfamily protein